MRTPDALILGRFSGVTDMDLGDGTVVPAVSLEDIHLAWKLSPVDVRSKCWLLPVRDIVGVIEAEYQT